MASREAQEARKPRSPLSPPERSGARLGLPSPPSPQISARVESGHNPPPEAPGAHRRKGWRARRKNPNGGSKLGLVPREFSAFSATIRPSFATSTRAR